MTCTASLSHIINMTLVHTSNVTEKKYSFPFHAILNNFVFFSLNRCHFSGLALKRVSVKFTFLVLK